MRIKNTNYVLVLLVAVLIGTFFLGFGNYAYANGDDLHSPPSAGSINQWVEAMPESLKSMINTAQQINFDTFNPIDIYNGVNGWFQETTGGISLSELVKSIGNFLVWSMTLVIKLIEFGLSFLR